MRCETHLRFVAKHRCVVCAEGEIRYVVGGAAVSQAAHVKYLGGRGTAEKRDEHAVPLCPYHHAEQHARGDERVWWAEQGIDPEPIAEALWQSRS